MTWEVFKKDFLDRFFPREKKESKAVEFIKLHQGGMSVLEYSLKFTKLSKYAPSLVSDPRDEMSPFITEVLDICKSSLIRLCYMKTLKFVVSWFMLSKWKRQGLRGRIEMPRGQDLLMVLLQMVG